MSMSKSRTKKNPYVEYFCIECPFCLIELSVKTDKGSFHMSHEKNSESAMESARLSSSEVYQLFDVKYVSLTALVSHFDHKSSEVLGDTL